MKQDDTNYISVWNRVKNDKIHKQKLKEISGRPRSLTIPESFRFSHLLQKGSIVQERERIRRIENENSYLFKRLNAVFGGRTVSRSTVTPRQGPSSLNFSLKKREAQRIEHENAALAKRLDSGSPSVINAKLKEDYKRNAEYSNRLAKGCMLEKVKQFEKRRPNTVRTLEKI